MERKNQKKIRSVKPFRYQVPSRQQMAEVLESLIQDETKRREISEWAGEYIIFDNPQLYPEVTDPAVWRTLKFLMGADLISTDREFLHTVEDFREWLNEIKTAP